MIDWVKVAVGCGVVGLISCGGGGGGKGSSSPGTDGIQPDVDTVLSYSQFQQAFVAQAQGVWRSESQVAFSQEISFGGGDTFTLTANARNVSLLTVAEAGSQQLAITFCDGREPVMESQFSDSLMAGISDAGDMEFCLDAETEFRYIQSNATKFRIEAYCEGEQASVTRLERIGSAPQFAAGTLSFSSTEFADLQADSGVCGELVRSVSTTRIAVLPIQTIRFSEIRFAAPYQGARVLISLMFNTDQPKTGSYTVISQSDGDSQQLQVQVAAAEFHGTPARPEVLNGHSGSVTLSSISEFAATGSFDLVLSNGDAFKGNFSISLD